MDDTSAGLVIFDLDNTLVNKNAVFEKAQNKMIEIIIGKEASKTDMRILREIDSILIKKHKKHLHFFEILALSLWFYYHKNLDIRESILKGIETFECTESEKKKKVVALAKKAVAAHNKILENIPPELFDGVKEILHTLKKRGFVLVLLSEGSPQLQRKTLETHGLEKYFNEIVICNQKDTQYFFDIKNHWNQSKDGKKPIYVVGDGITRDIEPGNEIGAITIWKPGDFDPGTPSPGKKWPNYTINDIRSLLTIIY